MVINKLVLLQKLLLFLRCDYNERRLNAIMILFSNEMHMESRLFCFVLFLFVSSFFLGGGSFIDYEDKGIQNLCNILITNLNLSKLHHFSDW